MVELENILDSKIKKIRIELPHYSFSHSSSGESSSIFVGRRQIKEKLKKIVEATTDKTGVYLVTGNRGVGKTSLVSQVINQTSLRDNSNFSQNLKYLFVLLFSVVVTQFCLQRFHISISALFWTVCALVSFIMLCWFSGYRRKIPKQKKIIWKIWNIVKEILNCTISVFIKKMIFFTNPYNIYRTTQYLLKIFFVVCCTQIFSKITYPTSFLFIESTEKGKMTPTLVFFYYLCMVFIIKCLQFIFSKLRGYYEKYKKDISTKIVIRLFKSFSLAFHEIRSVIFNKIKNYVKNYNRLYLRINFGHKLKNEKDILRLIARTLSAEYNKYHRSLLRLFFWRITTFCFLFLFAYLFSTIVEKQEFYKPIKIKSDLYQASSQIFLKDSVYDKNKDKERLQRALDYNGFFESKFNQAEIYLLVVDQLIFEISKRVVKIPQYLLEGEANIDETKIRMFIFPIDYLFWLSFFTMYLFCILIFRSSFITHFFITHQIIKRQLKKLNSDITHSTERENSANIESKSIRVGIGIGTRTKRTRSVADAREIEKELQNILDDVQRIPIFMCRPNFVIVFDELDKVEPDEVNLEKEIQKTKASLFSIDTTRERQTEILKILSNMKYFLSSAKAKFIFIAGREMYDIYLADVSDRNNYIGSIFNAVIYVPSFLTDHSDGTHADGIHLDGTHSDDMTSLTEEFVCQILIPHDYRIRYLVVSCRLKEYRKYLEKEIYNDTKIKKIERNIRKIIALQNNEKIEQKIIVLQNRKIEQIREVITEHKKEIIQEIIALQNKEIERKIQKIIDKPNKEIEQKIIALENGNREQIRNIIVELNKEIEQKIIYE